MNSHPKIDRDVVKSVLSYFRHHPGAADSVAGVAHWRLLEETVHQEIEETARALRWLTDRGYLIEESHPGVGPLYRSDPARAAARDALDVDLDAVAAGNTNGSEGSR